jgi:hypothetical protein
LDQYLFESINNIKAKILGDAIVQSVNAYEPRIEVQNVQVMPMPDQNQYYVIFVYNVLNIGRTDTFKINFQANNIDIYE